MFLLIVNKGKFSAFLLFGLLATSAFTLSSLASVQGMYSPPSDKGPPSNAGPRIFLITGVYPADNQGQPKTMFAQADEVVYAGIEAVNTGSQDVRIFIVDKKLVAEDLIVDVRGYVPEIVSVSSDDLIVPACNINDLPSSDINNYYIAIDVLGLDEDADGDGVPDPPSFTAPGKGPMTTPSDVISDESFSISEDTNIIITSSALASKRHRR